METIIYEKKGQVAYVTLNRPDKLNAMNDVMHRELGEAWADFRDDDTLRVAILSGNGRCFSAGADLSAGAPEKYTYTGEFPDISQTQKVYKPIISALHSHVVGYGLWIALDADIRIATEDTSFWLPEPQWGIATIPCAWFPKIMPWAIASELLLLAERVSAQRAYDLGLINQVVASGGALEAAKAMAAKIAANGPMAIAASKAVVDRAQDWSTDVMYAQQDKIIQPVFTSEDAIEGATAFAEKRAPNWKGK